MGDWISHSIHRNKQYSPVCPNCKNKNDPYIHRVWYKIGAFWTQKPRTWVCETCNLEFRWYIKTDDIVDPQGRI